MEENKPLPSYGYRNVYPSLKFPSDPSFVTSFEPPAFEKDVLPNETITTAHTTNIMFIDCVGYMYVRNIGAGLCNVTNSAGFRDLQ